MLMRFFKRICGCKRPQPYTFESVLREVVQRMKSEGHVESHVIEIGMNTAGECERKRGARARLIADAMFPGRETVLDIDATDVEAGKIVVLVAGIRQEETAC